ncbi:MAG: bifunctional [glutamine synthetase] adenylyltransferase/[glutamine synthetase]-adenylyl-L-tyrosine phosphorylase, partial [Nocardioides sp.]|nr:bifunctional [glutamine synthetase] adenylyltransferase/[glutamine synthetase]-adenylyl-L-tyrosine phosphorylase [Nocardioides sp.]
MPKPATQRPTLPGVGRLGLVAPTARDDLDRLGWTTDAHVELLWSLSRAPDADEALRAIVRIADELGDGWRELGDALIVDKALRGRLFGVLGSSLALGDHLVAQPESWHLLAGPVDLPSAADLRETFLAAAESATETTALPTLRSLYRDRLLVLAALDVAPTVENERVLAFTTVGEHLADLADAALEAALLLARRKVCGTDTPPRLAVIAMGKCGGHELNYVSDVDVVFVYEAVEGASDNAANRAATQLAAHLMRICSDPTGEGEIWPVDANLRPEGKSGPLVRTLASHEGYYQRWAKTWEFQALLKARPVAGDRALGRAYVDTMGPLVWTAVEREGFVEETQAMRRRVVDHIPSREAERQLKLGSGGLRDVEFAVQLLQMVHGRADPSIRPPTTLSALARLTRGGYIGREDGEALHEAYAFLRTLEHRMQLHQLRRLHVVPADEASMRRLGRSMGYLRDSATALDKEWQHHRREVRRLHQKLFYRPLLGAVALLPGEEARLSPEAARARLAALGYLDPEAALRHLEALTGGVSRAANIQRTLLPVMLQWFAEGPDPDAGLFGFRRISESLGGSPWYLQTLRDEGQVAERLAHVLATSRYATALLEREPQGVRMLGESLAPLPAEALTEEMLAGAARREDPDKAVRAVRAIRRRELFRIAAGDLLGLTDVTEVGAGLSRLTDATLEATLAVAGAAVRRQR